MQEQDKSGPKVNIVGPEQNDGNTLYVITSGRKSLTVKIAPSNHARTRIENITNIDNRIPGETTTVYSAARKVMEVEAINRSHPISYIFETGFPTMKKWADTRGRQIFDWIDFYPVVDDPQKIIAHAIVFPE